MKKSHLFGLVAISLALLSSGCASDGGFAAKGKPVDKLATLAATCTGLEHADAAFQALVAARPGLVDANGLAVERAVMLTIKPVCVQPYPGDVDAAMNVAIAALVNVSTLLDAWQPASP